MYSWVRYYQNRFGMDLRDAMQTQLSYGEPIMAQKVQVLCEDDLDGSPATDTIHFALDGTEYEIDLNETHAGELRDVFAPYVASGRKASFGARPGRTRRNGSKPTGDGVNTTEVREWAKSQGITVKDRGRIPAEIVAQFKAAKNGVQVPAPEPAPEPIPQTRFDAGEPDTSEGDGDKTDATKRTTARRNTRKAKGSTTPPDQP